MGARRLADHALAVLIRAGLPWQQSSQSAHGDITLEDSG